MPRFNIRKLVLTVLGVWRSQINVPAWLGSDVDSLPGLQIAILSHVSPHAERERVSVSASSYKDISPMSPILRISSKPNDLPEALPPSSLMQEVRVPTYEFGRSGGKGDTDLQSITVYLSETLVGWIIF